MFTLHCPPQESQRQGPLHPDIPKLIQNAWKCGRDENRRPKVCCPDPAIIPDKPPTKAIPVPTTTAPETITTTTETPETTTFVPEETTLSEKQLALQKFVPTHRYINK
ncbi:Serine protease easter [Caligus rogercresseyi]|uniref:Serine protease easter n=1 Tax=Caligus rogercresseyi TaxID=217165 RepID=A0A7T8JVL3_CALRO|nr:Serine protease easter [Caligus rogercresseyi]